MWPCRLLVGLLQGGVVLGHRGLQQQHLQQQGMLLRLPNRHGGCHLKLQPNQHLRQQQHQHQPR